MADDPRPEARQSKLKRKRQTKVPATKLTRTKLSADALPWKSVKTASFSGVDGGGGMMTLEELDDVDVEWEQHDDGRKTAHFVTSKKAPDQRRQPNKISKATAPVVDAHEGTDGRVEDGPPENTSSGPESASGSRQGDEELPSVESETVEQEVEEDPEVPFEDALLPDWSSCPLHPDLKRALLALGFVIPTEIQKRSLPLSVAGRDVVGVAETGSGKTLSYALPILSHLLRSPRFTSGRRRLSALMLCPTRELALQVVDHIQSVLKQALPEKQGPPRISIGSVIGGLSAQKQKRIVERGCDILVATPGRLWDLMKADEDLASGVRGIRFLVIDEADRMIENGHFAELENIVRLTEREQGASSGVDAADAEDPVFAVSQADVAARSDMQTFIFSATLSKELQHNLKKRKRIPAKKGGKKATALEDLVERLDFRDPKPAVIDLSPEGGVVASLRESMVECVVTEKDLYLYYFLLRYPGRSLVFVGSIDGIRRLVPLFEVLQVPVYPLHSQLQQKQRLKNLDRFKSSKDGVLIATDVAARGLDIPHVEHVVHFNLPRTADAYIHRSGRTARAQNPGFALQLVSAEDKGLQRALMKSLDRDVELPELPIENGFLPKLKERIRLAREIEKAQHGVKKENHDKNWLLEAAEALDVDIDPSMLSDGDDPDRPFARKQKKGADGKVASLRAELKALLAEPLVARGVSARYPTSGSKIIIDDLLSAKGHPTLLGASSTKAYDEVHTSRPAKKLRRGKPKTANGK